MKQILSTIKQSLIFLYRLLFLKPYGSQLLSKSGRSWLFGGTFLVLFVCIIEGIIWGSVVYSFLRYSAGNPFDKYIGIFVGGLIAIIIWYIDSSLFTLDLRKLILKEDEKGQVIPSTDHNVTEDDSHPYWTIKIWRFIKSISKSIWIYKPFGFRIILAAFSALLTAPQAPRIFVIQEAVATINEYNDSIRKSYIDSINGDYNQHLSILNHEIDSLGGKLENEVGGAGVSKQYGYGQTARVLDTLLHQKMTDRDNLVKKSTDADTLYAALTDEQLSNKYGLKFLKKNTLTVDEYVRKLMPSTSVWDIFKSSKATFVSSIQILILFIVLCIIGLKSLSPKSLIIYYDEELQEFFNDLKHGRVKRIYLQDSHEEFKNPLKMSPFEFENWYYTVYKPWRLSDLKLMQADEEYRKLESTLIRINSDLDVITSELYNVKEKYNITKIDKINLNAEAEDIKLKIGNFNELLSKHQNLLEKLDETSVAGHAEDALSFFAAKDQLRNSIGETKLKLNEYSINLIKSSLPLKDYNTELESLTKAISEIENTHYNLTILKYKLRNSYYEIYARPIPPRPKD